MKTRDQFRAERASVHIASVKADVVKEYAAEARAFAPAVSQGGLGVALASLKSKGSVAKSSLYDHLSGWVAESVFAEPKADLLALVIKSPSSKVVRAQEEALLYAGWLKRFVEAREPKARKA